MEPSLFGTSGLPGVDNETQVMDEWTFCSILGKTRCAEAGQCVHMLVAVLISFI